MSGFRSSNRRNLPNLLHPNRRIIGIHQPHFLPLPRINPHHRAYQLRWSSNPQ